MFAVGLRVAREYPSPKATLALINLYNKLSSKDVNRLSALLKQSAIETIRGCSFVHKINE
jgi:hypothetical protein